MVIERAELPIQEGKEEEFQAKLAEVMPHMQVEGGPHAIQVGRGIEDPTTFILVVTWDSPEHHGTFAQTDDFAKFAEVARGYCRDKPRMEHFDPAGQPSYGSISL